MEPFAGKAFTSICTNTGANYVITQNWFDKNSVVSKRFVYSDAVCATLLYTNIDTYDSKEVGIIPNTEGATGFDLTLNSQEITLMNSTLVDAWNQSASCGIQDWQLNTPVTIGDGTACSDPKIFLILNKIEAGILYPGDYPNGVNPAVRPTAVTKNPALLQTRIPTMISGKALPGKRASGKAGKKKNER
jgi:hypothetical protein